jgi:hypothetical protein
MTSIVPDSPHVNRAGGSCGTGLLETATWDGCEGFLRKGNGGKLLAPRMGEGFGEAANGAETLAKELPRVLAKLSSLARLEEEGEYTNSVNQASHPPPTFRTGTEDRQGAASHCGSGKSTCNQVTARFRYGGHCGRTSLFLITLGVYP